MEENEVVLQEAKVPAEFRRNTAYKESDSYANIVETESVTVIYGRDDLNGDHLRTKYKTAK